MKDILTTASKPLLCITVVSLLAAAVFSTGCSAPPPTLAVTYDPLVAADCLVSSNPAPIVFVTRFIDNRQNVDIVGKLGSKELVTTDDLEVAMSEAMTDAMRKAGFRAEMHSDCEPGEQMTTREASGCDFIAGGRIRTLEVIGDVGGFTPSRITSQVVIDVYIEYNGKSEWIGPIEGSCTLRSTFIDATFLSTGLNKAMQNCMRNMIRHLKASGVIEPIVADRLPVDRSIEQQAVSQTD